MTEKAPKKPLPDHDIATRIMERMVRMPPKPHSEMKLSKRKASWPPGPPFIELFEELRLLLEQPGVPRSAADSFLQLVQHLDKCLRVKFAYESAARTGKATIVLECLRDSCPHSGHMIGHSSASLSMKFAPPAQKRVSLLLKRARLR